MSYSTMRWAIMVLLVVTIMLIAKLAFAGWSSETYGDSTRWSDDSGNTVRCTQYGDSTRCD